MSEIGEVPKNLVPLENFVKAKVMLPRTPQYEADKKVVKEKAMEAFFDDTLDKSQKELAVQKLFEEFGSEFIDSIATIETVKKQKEIPTMDSIRKQLIEEKLQMITESIIEIWVDSQNPNELDALGTANEKNIKTCLHPKLYGLEEDISNRMVSNVKLRTEKIKYEKIINNPLKPNKDKIRAYNDFCNFLSDLEEGVDIPSEDWVEVMALGSTYVEIVNQIDNVASNMPIKAETNKDVDRDVVENVNRANEEFNKSYQEYMARCDKEPWLTRYSKEEYKREVDKAIRFRNRYGNNIEVMKDLGSQLEFVRKIIKELDDRDDTRSISNSGPFEILDKITRDNSPFLPEVRQEVSATLHNMRCRYYMAYAGGLVGSAKTRQSIDALMEDIHQHDDFLNRSDWFFFFRDGANGIPFCEMFDLCQLAGYGKPGEGYPKILKDMSEDSNFLDYLIKEKPEFAIKAAIRRSQENDKTGPDDPIFVNLKGKNDQETIINLINNWLCTTKEKDSITKTKELNKYYISEKGLHENYFFDKDEARRIFVGGYLKWKIANELLKSSNFVNEYGDIDKYSETDRLKLMKKAMDLSNLAYEHVVNFFHTTEEMAIFNVAFGGHDDYREIICWESNQFDRIDKVKVNSADYYLGGEVKKGKRNYFDNTILGVVVNKTLLRSKLDEKMDKFVYKGKIKSLGTTIVRSIAYKGGREAYKKGQAMGVYDGPIKAKDVLVDLIHDEVGKINLYFWYSALLGKKLARLNETLMTRKFKKETLLDGDWWQNLVDDCRKCTDYGPIGTIYVGEPTEKLKDKNGNIAETELDFKLRRSYGLRLIVMEGIMELLSREMGEKGQTDLMFNAYDIGQLEKLVTNPYYTYENLNQEEAKDKDGKTLLDNHGKPIMIKGRDPESKISFVKKEDFIKIVDKYRSKILRRDFSRAINNAGHK